MPLQTYFNLKPERQKEIIDASFEEFALNEYATASLGNIIKKLSIAKGSFYRYFKNKQDLYFYLIEYATKERFAQVGELFSDTNISFNELIVQNFATKIKFELKNPLISGFLYNVSQERNNDEIGNIQLMIKKKVMDMIVELLEQHKKNWSLKTNVATSQMAYMIMQVQLGIFDYLELKYGISIRENVKQGKSALELGEDVILNDVRSFAILIETGIKKSKS
jgi:AcrR family transcriptional regulator